MIPQSGADSLRFFDFPEAGGPDYRLEAELAARGRRAVAGVDEAGRGPLAGPVVAAAVILDPDNIPAGLDDSKKLGRERREALFAELAASARIAWRAAPSATIDRVNILRATLQAMAGAVAALDGVADACLIDGRDVPPELRHIGRAVVRGDARCLSIAAASIVAKVARDRLMARMDLIYPGYGFARNAGYGTPEHLSGLARMGPCPQHRRSYAPVRDTLLNLADVSSGGP